MKDKLHLVLIGCASFVLSHNIENGTTDILSYFVGCFLFNYVFETFIKERLC